MRTLFDASYENRKRPLLNLLEDRLRGLYAQGELEAIRIVSVPRETLLQPAGQGGENPCILDSLLGNLLECAAPGAHCAGNSQGNADLPRILGEVADQLYAAIVHALLAADDPGDVPARASESAFALLGDLPDLKRRAFWNRFASLHDPAVWDAYLIHRHGLKPDWLSRIDLAAPIAEAIAVRDTERYREFLKGLDLGPAYNYQMRLVTATYPGWRALFYHDIAHALTRSDPPEILPGVGRIPVPFLPRAISEYASRQYQADLHPETRIGDANFLDHTHRGLTTGQTGVIGYGCHLLPCTLGGLSERVQQRHPLIGNFVHIGTDAGIFGPVQIADHSAIGANAEIYGFVEIGPGCRIGTSAILGTVRSGNRVPGKIQLGEGVRVGDGTVIENSAELDLVIPGHAEIPARCHVRNDGFGRPQIVE